MIVFPLRAAEMRRTSFRRLAVIVLMICGGAILDTQAHAEQADAILIEKSEHKLMLLKDGTVIKTYRVSLGPHPVGPKTQEGDGRTPEGHYVISGRNAGSHYHRSLHVSYPNAVDRKRAAKLHVATGGDIMIHGLPNGYGGVGKGHIFRDWTAGCIAVTNEEIEEIWDEVPDGTPVDIKP